MNVVDDDGSAATHWAASSGKSLCASVLLRADDVDVDVVNDKGLIASDLIDPADVATRTAFEMANASFQPHVLAADGRLAILRRALANTFKVAALDPASPRARRARRRFGDDANTNTSSSSPPLHDDDDTKGVVHTIEPEKEKPPRVIRRAPIAIDEKAPDGSGETMAMRAARFGRAETLRALVCEFGADLDARCARIGATATHFAAENGHVDVLRVVRDASGFPRSRKRRAEARTDRPAFRAAFVPASSFADSGESEKSTPRRRERVKIQTAPVGSTPLHFAARNGHAETCAFLVEDMHCDVNAADGDGQTAAHVAAARGRLETLKRLRRLGANLDARDVDGKTPLHVFASSTTFFRASSSSDDEDVSSEMVAFFLEGDPETETEKNANASVRSRRLEARDGRGDAPAHVAFASGVRAETALALLPNVFFSFSKTPKTPNTPNGEYGERKRDAAHFRGCGGWTCLHFAARGGHLELVDRLTKLESTDVAAADDAGATALHVAAETGVVAVLESLLAAAAERSFDASVGSKERSETNANANPITHDMDFRLVGARARREDARTPVRPLCTWRAAPVTPRARAFYWRSVRIRSTRETAPAPRRAIARRRARTAEAPTASRFCVARGAS